jgi:hypothetical protein
MSSTSVRVTTFPAIKNAPLAGLAEGNGSFSNLHLAALVLGVPYVLKSILPIVSRGGFKTYIFLVILTGVPTTIAYWTLNSLYGSRKNEKIQLPGKNIEEYISIKDVELKSKYNGREKIPMQVFHDAYFDGKIDFNGGSLPCSFIHESRMTKCRRRVGGDGSAFGLGQNELHARAFQICPDRVLT